MPRHWPHSCPTSRPWSSTEDAALHYAEIRADLKRRGAMIGANDLFIAAHARALGLTLVTNNTAEFERVQGLRSRTGRNLFGENAEPFVLKRVQGGVRRTMARAAARSPVEGGAVVPLENGPGMRGAGWDIAMAASPWALRASCCESPRPARRSPSRRGTGELFPLYPQILPGGRAILFSADKSRGRPC